MKSHFASEAFSILCYLVLFGLYAPVFLWLFRLAWAQPDYSHALLLPLVSAYITWQRRSDLKLSAKLTILELLAAFALAVTALLIFAAGKLTISDFTLWLSFFPALLALSLPLFGFSGSRHMLAPLLILFLSKPIPDALVPLLFNTFQSWTAHAAVWILERFHVPVYLRGNIIDLPRMSLMVEEACSGLRSLLALLSVSAVFLVTTGWSRRTKLAVFASACLLALFFNILRVIGTATLVVWGHESLAEGFFHSFSGLVSFLSGFIILYYFGEFVERTIVNTDANLARPPSSSEHS